MQIPIPLEGLLFKKKAKIKSLYTRLKIYLFETYIQIRFDKKNLIADFKTITNPKHYGKMLTSYQYYCYESYQSGFKLCCGFKRF